MRALIQRVLNSEVTINGRIHAEIGKGLLVFLGIEDEDTKDDIDWLVKKIVNMRIFPDENGVMNESLIQQNHDILLVSQFTLHASTKKGNRPSYIKSAKPEVAVPIYEQFKKEMSMNLGKPIKTGEFGADMKVSLVNDGPVTIFVDTKQKE